MSTLDRVVQRRGRKRESLTAFVLGGGGNLGAVQAGMLRALSERDIVGDLILGCSVGALNGAAYAADPSPVGVARIVQTWKSLENESSELMPSSFIPSPVQLIRKGESLHSDIGLRTTIENFLGEHRRFEDLSSSFQCVATDVESASEKWFSEGEIVEPILASAALPAVYPTVVIDDHRYMDGGVVNNVPLARAVELGATKIYVLHVGLHGRPRSEIRRPLDAALIGYWIARNARFARDLEAVPADTEVILLPPGERRVPRYDDFGQSSDLVRQGFESARTYLAELEDSSKEGMSLAERLASDTRRVIDELVGKVSSRRSGHVADTELIEDDIEDEESEDAHLIEAAKEAALESDNAGGE